MKVIQGNLATVVNQYSNTWLAFGLLGVLQGGVYGHMNQQFSKYFKLGKEFKITGIINY